MATNDYNNDFRTVEIPHHLQQLIIATNRAQSNNATAKLTNALERIVDSKLFKSDPSKLANAIDTLAKAKSASLDVDYRVKTRERWANNREVSALNAFRPAMWKGMFDSMIKESNLQKVGRIPLVGKLLRDHITSYEDRLYSDDYIGQSNRVAISRGLSIVDKLDSQQDQQDNDHYSQRQQRGRSSSDQPLTVKQHQLANQDLINRITDFFQSIRPNNKLGSTDEQADEDNQRRQAMFNSVRAIELNVANIASTVAKLSTVNTDKSDDFGGFGDLLKGIGGTFIGLLSKARGGLTGLGKLAIAGIKPIAKILTTAVGLAKPLLGKGGEAIAKAAQSLTSAVKDLPAVKQGKAVLSTVGKAAANTASKIRDAVTGNTPKLTTAEPAKPQVDTKTKVDNNAKDVTFKSKADKLEPKTTNNANAKALTVDNPNATVTKQQPLKPSQSVARGAKTAVKGVTKLGKAVGSAVIKKIPIIGVIGGFAADQAIAASEIDDNVEQMKQQGASQEEIEQYKSRAHVNATGQSVVTAAGGLIGGLIGAIGGPLGSLAGQAAGAAIADQIADSDFAKSIFNTIGDWLNSKPDTNNDNKARDDQKDEQPTPAYTPTNIKPRQVDEQPVSVNKTSYQGDQINRTAFEQQQPQRNGQTTTNVVNTPNNAVSNTTYNMRSISPVDNLTSYRRFFQPVGVV